jgi:hypothetical protein
MEVTSVDLSDYKEAAVVNGQEWWRLDDYESSRYLYGSPCGSLILKVDRPSEAQSLNEWIVWSQLLEEGHRWAFVPCVAAGVSIMGDWGYREASWVIQEWVDFKDHYLPLSDPHHETLRDLLDYYAIADGLQVGVTAEGQPLIYDYGTDRTRGQDARWSPNPDSLRLVKEFAPVG